MKRFAVLSLIPALSLFAFACDSDDGDDEVADTAGTDETTAGETGTDLVCGEEFVEKDGTTPTIMTAWGAPCMVDADCEGGLGAGAKCITNILGVFDLPGGYCTRECSVGSTDVSFVLDDPECDPAGGVACVGIDGSFTACAPVCASDSECGREGYGCTIMPLIGAEGDPTFCLMSADACCTAPGSC
ncbi:hypothetical protein ACNOYE_03995 [Nannocystaceae bacterium ST9]